MTRVYLGFASVAVGMGTACLLWAYPLFLNYSITVSQAHQYCSNQLVSALLPQQCQNVDTLWWGGLLLIGVCAVTLIACIAKSTNK